jgi:hypothetical protein
MLERNYNVKIVKQCTKFDFHLRKSINKADEKKYKKHTVVFSGKRTEHHQETAKSSLLGFVSNSENLYNSFNFEYERLKRKAIPESSDKERLIEYIKKMIEK